MSNPTKSYKRLIKGRKIQTAKPTHQHTHTKPSNFDGSKENFLIFYFSSLKLGQSSIRHLDSLTTGIKVLPTIKQVKHAVEVQYIMTRGLVGVQYCRYVIKQCFLAETFKEKVYSK